ncbi:MAG TPA: DNA polymerase Y family protein [Mycobacteriales bacterium]|nr:DNA polymerase Y family protein [Mycobacteriales bacterium]
MPVRTVVVRCPDWPVLSAMAAAGVDAEGAGAIPAAVVFANRVVSTTPAARAEGVRRGLRRREAQSRCPQLVVLPPDPARDARAFEPVVGAVAELAPGVEVIRPGLCAVAARGPARYFGGDRVVADRLARYVADRTRARCVVGVADGRFAAALAAQHHLVVPRGGSRAFLAPYPVETLGVPDLPDLLRRLGLRTLGAFAELPPRDVLARFGPDGARAHRLARGLDDRPLAARAAAPELAVQTELDPPVERVDTVAFAAKALAEQLHEGLARRGLACTRVAIEAQTEHGEQLTRLWRHEGVLTPAAIADRVRWQLDGWLSGSARVLPRATAPPPGTPPAAPTVIGADSDLPPAPPRGAGTQLERPTAGIVLLRLIPDEVIPYGGMQLGLWGGMGESDERAGRVLARVQGMLGPDRVLTAVLGGGRGPDDQVQLVPWGDRRTPDRPAEPPWPGRLPAPSPATVLPDPIPVEVTDAAGVPVEVTDRFAVTGHPARLAIAGRPPVEIASWTGPWAVDERWWDPATATRQARFQLVGTDGTAWLVTRDPTRWHLEATYD